VLELKSPAVMMGYHNRPDVASPITEDGFYSTGDVFRRDENGFYFFLGRDDDMFVSGAENIFPGEVEHVIESAPGRDAGLCRAGGGRDQGHEARGLRRAACAGRRSMNRRSRTYVLDNAPAYQHPRRVWFLEKLPLASTNKIDRNALRDRAEAEVNGGQER
jgi:long-chain acyl-CoA synthetase